MYLYASFSLYPCVVDYNVLLCSEHVYIVFVCILCMNTQIYKFRYSTIII